MTQVVTGLANCAGTGNEGGKGVDRFTPCAYKQIHGVEEG